jgi:hypothetical protein
MTTPTHYPNAPITEASDLLDQLGDYRRPPFERAGVRRVRYIGIRSLKPRRIEIEDDE